MRSKHMTSKSKSSRVLRTKFFFLIASFEWWECRRIYIYMASWSDTYTTTAIRTIKYYYFRLDECREPMQWKKLSARQNCRAALSENGFFFSWRFLSCLFLYFYTNCHLIGMDNEVEWHDGYHLLVVVVGGLLQFKVNRKWIALLERITVHFSNWGIFPEYVHFAVWMRTKGVCVCVKRSATLDVYRTTTHKWISFDCKRVVCMNECIDIRRYIQNFGYFLVKINIDISYS